ncbi:polyadenylate-binding protein 2-like [Arachis duranensis]|uniref:Polyadenylate-binding protein 2-like n=1 Tax=Arachis duranensis TaxID=130453 RepID=A0A9C6TR15_ARADU|nr:polyadenylate-binding protein 2-like [Arachis duranensis]
MDKCLKDIEDETATLKDMQAKVEKEKESVHDLGTASASLVNREEIDSRSVFVGNVSSLIPSLLEKFLCCLAVFSSPLMIWTEYIIVLTSFEDINIITFV